LVLKFDLKGTAEFLVDNKDCPIVDELTDLTTTKENNNEKIEEL
jgi:hypothetical protein